MPTPTAIYLRVSTLDQAQGESPEHHEKRARLYAEMKGWEVVEVYDLCGVSGKSVMEHPETKRMIEDVKVGRIKALIFSKLARLARNTKELLELSEIFQKHDANLVSLQESIDTSSPAGRLFYTMIAALAQWEREEIGERIRASIPIRAQMGKPMGGSTSYGYNWKDGVLQPDEKEAPIRKLIYELFLEHQRKRTVARILNEQGYRTRNGSQWTGTTIDRLLRDPIAKGVRRVNYTTSTDPEKTWALKPEEDWVYHEVEPIVSAELWDQCNQIMAEKKTTGKRTPRKSVHLFAGVVECHCGHKMYVPSNSPKYTCYECRNKIPAVDLEAIFHEQLKDFLLSDDELASYLSAGQSQVGEKENQIEILTRESQKLKKEMDLVYSLYVEQKISSDGFAERYQPLEERHRQICDQLPQIQAELDLLKINLLSSDQLLEDTRDLYTRWPDLSREDKRKIIEAITESIVIENDGIAINLCYLPTNEAESLLPTHHPLNDGNSATNPQGFMAAISWNRAG